MAGSPEHPNQRITALPSRRKTAPLTLERRHGGIVVGLDEVGRSPFAGPVMAAAVSFPSWSRTPKSLAGLTDSKMLSRAEREAYCVHIRRLGQVGLGAASTAEIARINIHNASLLAMQRAYRRLGVSANLALVDGKFAPALPCPTETIVRGDSRSLSIAAASVIAKVARDRMMERLARRYPGYGWDRNAGYGTEDHYVGLMRLGPSPHHRLSFDTVRGLAGNLFCAGRRFEAITEAVPKADLFPLRRDCVAVFDGDGCHIGFVKSSRGDWQFHAIGYSANGEPLDGGGPCAGRHLSPVDGPSAAALTRILFAGA